MSSDDSEDVLAANLLLLQAENQLRAVEGLLTRKTRSEGPFCSFCGNPKSDVAALVEGKNAYICLECTQLARRLLLGAS